MTKAEEILQTLITRLQGITVAGGYQSEVSAVLRGHEAVAVNDDLPLPYLTVQTIAERELDHRADRGRLEREILIVALLEVTPDLDEKQARLMLDIRRALRIWESRPLNGLALTIAENRGDYDVPEQGSEIVAFNLSITLTYVEIYS